LEVEGGERGVKKRETAKKRERVYKVEGSFFSFPVE
jgi:hypothetical protein